MILTVLLLHTVFFGRSVGADRQWSYWCRCPLEPWRSYYHYLIPYWGILLGNFLWQHPQPLRGCFFLCAQPLTLKVKPGTKRPSCCRVCESRDIYFPDAADLVASCSSSSRRCEKTHLSPNTQTPAQCDAEHNRLYSTMRHKYRHFYNSRFKKNNFSSRQLKSKTSH